MKKGFTMIELLVVATIIAVLVIVGVVSYSSTTKKSRDAKRKSDIEQIRSALEMYRADQALYPDVNGNADSVLGTGVLVSNYMPNIPTDPLSTQNYHYESVGGPYSYYLMAILEQTPAAGVNSCTPTGTYNYCQKNP